MRAAIQGIAVHNLCCFAQSARGILRHAQGLCKMRMLATRKSSFFGSRSSLTSLASARDKGVERHPELVAELVLLHQDLVPRAGNAQMRGGLHAAAKTPPQRDC